MITQSAVKLNPDGSLVRAAAPENAGVCAETVLKMLDYLESENFQYHSLMIVRNGVVAAECYRSPLAANFAHTMYSVSKTITSTAIGFAVSEGLFSLDSKVIDFFPEYRKKKEKNEYIEKMTVGHLLTMTSGKLPSALLNKTADDWASHLFNAKWVSEPGTKFDYVNENMYVLSALLHRVTGAGMVDYLMPRLFEPLKIERPFWESDGHGVEAGGWGIFLKTEDLAKIMLCYLNGGRWGEKQIIPAEWPRQATHNRNGVREGYGCGIWLKNSDEYFAGGMFTQLGYVFEEENCVAVITSCSSVDAAATAALNMLKKEGFIEPNLNKKADESFLENLGDRQLDAVPESKIRSNLEEQLRGKKFHFKKSFMLNLIGFPPSVLHLAAVYMGKYRAGNIDDVSFDFEGDVLNFSWREGNECNCVKCSMLPDYAYSDMLLSHAPYIAAACAFWEDEMTLNVWLRPVQTLCCRKLRFSFEKHGRVKMKLTSSPTAADIVKSVSADIHAMARSVKLEFAADRVIKAIEKLVEPVQKGRSL